jgi:hypothetical protein
MTGLGWARSSLRLFIPVAGFSSREARPHSNFPQTGFLARNNFRLARDSDTLAKVAHFSLLSLPICINYG